MTRGSQSIPCLTDDGGAVDDGVGAVFGVVGVAWAKHAFTENLDVERRPGRAAAALREFSNENFKIFKMNT